MSQKLSHVRDFKFAVAFLGVCLAVFLSAIDIASVATALPTISTDLKAGSSYVWLGSAYTLAAASCLSLCGMLSHLFGRRPILLMCLSSFAIGSAVSGSARNITSMIVGRVFQGIGAGGISTVSGMVLADLIPLSDRGKFQGFFAAIYALAGGIGPVIGGALAQRASWRWLFFLNLPICVASMVLIGLFLDTRRTLTHSPLGETIRRLDCFGNFLIVLSTASCTLSLTWSGTTFAWSSVQVLLPFCLGIAGLFSAFVYELKVATYPTIFPALLSTRTAISGYVGHFLWSMITTSLLYFIPVYFQGSKSFSALRSGVLLLGLAIVLPVFSVLGGRSVARFKRYRPQNIAGWCILIGGLATHSTLHSDSSVAKAIGAEVLTGCGLGILAVTMLFPALAPVKVEQQPFAVSLYTFCRIFAQTWGITLGGAVVQNQLDVPLSSVVVVHGSSILVQKNLGDALSVFFKVLCGLAGLGLLLTFLQREIPLTNRVAGDQETEVEGKKQGGESQESKA